MWGSLATIGANIKNTINDFENSMDQAVGRPGAPVALGALPVLRDSEVAGSDLNPSSEAAAGPPGAVAPAEGELGSVDGPQEVACSPGEPGHVREHSPMPPPDVVEDEGQEAVGDGALWEGVLESPVGGPETPVQEGTPPIDGQAPGGWGDTDELGGVDEVVARDLLEESQVQDGQHADAEVETPGGEPAQDHMVVGDWQHARPGGEARVDGEAHVEEEEEEEYEEEYEEEEGVTEGRQVELLEDEEQVADAANQPPVPAPDGEEAAARSAGQELARALARVADLEATLAERERQLETKTQLLAEAHSQLDSMGDEIRGLRAGGDHAQALQQEVHRLRAALEGAEANEERVCSLVEEGQKLAKKEGDLQKLIRDKNAKLEELEKDRNRVKKERDGLAELTKQLEGTVRQHRDQTSATSQSLAAMQAVSNASSNKLSAVENELRTAREAEKDLRTALDSAWAAEKEQKKLVHELRAENEDLQQRMGHKQEKETQDQESRRELEQREALLQASQRQLQDTLARQQHEASLREESLREELAGMRQRWKDSTQRAEEIAAGVHESTKPLLHQIRALQDESRVKAQAWAASEATFMERTATAEESARSAEQAKAAAEQRIAEAQARRAALEADLDDTKSHLAVASAEAKASAARQRAAEDRLVELEAELQALQENQRKGAREAKVIEAKLRSQLSEATEAAEDLRAEVRAERDLHASKLVRLQEELEDLRAGGSMNLPLTPSPAEVAAGGGWVDFSPSFVGPPSTPLKGRGTPRPRTPQDVGGEELSALGSGASAQAAYVMQLEKLRLLLKQRESENAGNQERLRHVEEVRDALTHELQELGRQNAEFKVLAEQSAALKQEVKVLVKKNDLLLELLGEKTEELEEAQDELVRLKGA